MDQHTEEMTNITPTKYISRNELTEEALTGWIEKLDAGSCHRLKKPGLFEEKEVDFASQESLLELIFEDLEYQEGIAISAIEQFGVKLPIGIQTYCWEVSLEKISLLQKQKFLSINLALETSDPTRGRILFPLMVVKCKNNVLKYWGVIDMGEALSAVRTLLEPDSEEPTA